MDIKIFLKKFDYILENTNSYPVPTPFCFNKNKIRAIVLGCDPSNFSKNKTTVLLKTVFGIGSGDSRYFQDILKNLKHIGLNLENIYVQNVIPFYMKKETSKNPYWNEIADAFLPALIRGLDLIDNQRKIPVLMTSEVIYKFLLLDKDDYCKPKGLYSDLKFVPVPKERNKLGRSLFPLYRHYKYSLSLPEWNPYLELLQKTIMK